MGLLKQQGASPKPGPRWQEWAWSLAWGSRHNACSEHGGTAFTRVIRPARWRPMAPSGSLHHSCTYPPSWHRQLLYYCSQKCHLGGYPTRVVASPWTGHSSRFCPLTPP